MKWLCGVILVLLMALTVQPANAMLDGVSLIVTGWDCNPDGPSIFIELTATSAGGDPEPYQEIFGYEVIDGDGTILAQSAYDHSWMPGTIFAPTGFAIRLPRVPIQNPVTIKIIDWDINNEPTGAEWSFEADCSCLDEPEEVVDEPEEVVDDEGNPGLEIGGTYWFFSEDADGGMGLEIWGIGLGTEVVQLCFISADDLAALPEYPEENLWIADAIDGSFSLYKLTTGEYQINFAPTESGHVQVLILDDLPPTEVYHADYNIYD